MRKSLRSCCQICAQFGMRATQPLQRWQMPGTFPSYMKRCTPCRQHLCIGQVCYDLCIMSTVQMPTDFEL